MSKLFEGEKEIPAYPMTLKELMVLYKFKPRSYVAFHKFISSVEYKLRYKQEKRRKLTTKEVKYIFEVCGTPIIESV